MNPKGTGRWPPICRSQGAVQGRKRALDRELQGVEQRITRLVGAISAGRPVEKLVARLKMERSRKVVLTEEQRTLRARDMSHIPNLTSRLLARAADLRRVLGAHVGRTRQTPRGDAARQSGHGASRGRRAPRLPLHRMPTTKLNDADSCWGRGPQHAKRPKHLIRTKRVIRWWPQRDSNPCFSLERAVS